MITPPATGHPLHDGWYSDAELAEYATAPICHEHADCDGARSEARKALATSLRIFLRRAANLAEAYGVYEVPKLCAGPHRVHVESDRVTGVEFSEEA